MLPRLPLFPEPPAREQKPQPADLPPTVTRQIEHIVGDKITAGQTVQGGLSVSAAFIFTFARGRKVFAKGSHPGDTAHGSKNLAQEIMAYEGLSLLRNVAPPYIGLVSDSEEGGWMLGLWDCVAHDPAGASAERVISSLASWQRPEGADAEAARTQLPAARAHVYLSGILGVEKKWRRLCNDEAARQKFLGLFADPAAGRNWFDKNAPALARHQALSGGALGPEGLVHGDLRLDNFLFGIEASEKEGRTYVIDWPNACWGPLLFDLAFLFSNMEALGFGPAEAFFDAYGRKTGTVFAVEQQAIMFSALSGYFADQAYREVPDKMPRLRWMQKAMLLAQLNILARKAVIESPPSMIGQNQ